MGHLAVRYLMKVLWLVEFLDIRASLRKSHLPVGAPGVLVDDAILSKLWIAAR